MPPAEPGQQGLGSRAGLQGTSSACSVRAASPLLQLLSFSPLLPISPPASLTNPARTLSPTPTPPLLQDVAVNVVGKYRYRMTSPADSTWVPLIIDIILVGQGGREWGAVERWGATAVWYSSVAMVLQLRWDVLRRDSTPRGGCLHHCQNTHSAAHARRVLTPSTFAHPPQVGRTKIITLHSGIWLENAIDRCGWWHAGAGCRSAWHAMRVIPIASSSK